MFLGYSRFVFADFTNFPSAPCPATYVCITPSNLSNYVTTIPNTTFKRLSINQSMCGAGCGGVLVSGVTINTGVNATNAIRIDGVNNVRVENSTIIGGETGVFVIDSTNVDIINNTIRDQSDADSSDTSWNGTGIRLSNTKGNNNIMIKGNTITNNDADGILVAQNDNGFSNGQPNTINPVYNLNVQIIDNVIDTVAKNASVWPGHYHGMYIQAGDTVIQGNIVKNVADGNGISLRSSGTVSCNYIENVGKAGIAYYADHGRGVNNLLTIENNVVYDTGKNPDSCCRGEPAIRLLAVPDYTDYYSGNPQRDPRGDPSWYVQEFAINNNTLLNSSQIFDEDPGTNPDRFIITTTIPNIYSATNPGSTSCNLPTATPTPVPTATATFTPMPTATSTPVPTATPAPLYCSSASTGTVSSNLLPVTCNFASSTVDIAGVYAQFRVLDANGTVQSLASITENISLLQPSECGGQSSCAKHNINVSTLSSLGGTYTLQCRFCYSGNICSAW